MFHGVPNSRQLGQELDIDQVSLKMFIVLSFPFR